MALIKTNDNNWINYISTNLIKGVTIKIGNELIYIQCYDNYCSNILYNRWPQYNNRIPNISESRSISNFMYPDTENNARELHVNPNLSTNNQMIVEGLSSFMYIMNDTLDNVNRLYVPLHYSYSRLGRFSYSGFGWNEYKKPDKPFKKQTPKICKKLKECPICYDIKQYIKYKCGHIICETCFDNLDSNSTCHLCRQDIVLKN